MPNLTVSGLIDWLTQFAAVLFGYFEVLLGLNNRDIIARERNRMLDLKASLSAIPMIGPAGADELELVSEFEHQFRELDRWLHGENPVKMIQDVFNNNDVGAHVLYSIRVCHLSCCLTLPSDADLL